jgi:hypothetical protein
MCADDDVFSVSRIKCAKEIEKVLVEPGLCAHRR